MEEPHPSEEFCYQLIHRGFTGRRRIGLDYLKPCSGFNRCLSDCGPDPSRSDSGGNNLAWSTFFLARFFVDRSSRQRFSFGCHLAYDRLRVEEFMP